MGQQQRKSKVKDMEGEVAEETKAKQDIRLCVCELVCELCVCVCVCVCTWRQVCG